MLAEHLWGYPKVVFLFLFLHKIPKLSCLSFCFCNCFCHSPSGSPTSAFHTPGVHQHFLGLSPWQPTDGLLATASCSCLSNWGCKHCWMPSTSLGTLEKPWVKFVSPWSFCQMFPSNTEAYPGFTRWIWLLLWQIQLTAMWWSNQCCLLFTWMSKQIWWYKSKATISEHYRVSRSYPLEHLLLFHQENRILRAII